MFDLVWLRMRAGCVLWFGLVANEGLFVCFDGD